MSRHQPETTAQKRDDTPLTGLERELLNYVERLTTASETSAAQFIALEKRSTGMIMERQSALDHCVRSLIESQTLLIAALNEFASMSPGCGSAQQVLRASMTALHQAEQGLPQPPE